jgi:hypothetical protein
MPQLLQSLQRPGIVHAPRLDHSRRNR